MERPTHAQLVEMGNKWLRVHTGCVVVLSEYACRAEAIPDVIGFRPRYSYVIECKVSRKDFLADRRKPHRQGNGQFGNFRYYLTLPDVATAADMYDGWGLLYPYKKGLRTIVLPTLHKDLAVKDQDYAILFSIARRCELRGYLKDIQGGNILSPADLKT